ncbi:MAG: hypothetical protein HY769_08705 [Candidatus Stahlbacteria bacterium]|nr:hypothetical protein [Candidatus Stahlbacteria bacterium]
MPYYIPARDAEFEEWFKIFKTHLPVIGGIVGLPAAIITKVTTEYATWKTGYDAYLLLLNQMIGATATKNNRRGTSESAIRDAVNLLQPNPAVTDDNRGLLGITIRDTEPSPIGAPTDTSGISIDFADRLRHTVHWGPNPMNERENGKPIGVYSAEIRMKVDTMPTGPEDMEFVAIDTRSPYVANMQDMAGKIVYWRVRYLNNKGEPGPWSEVISAEVTG